MPVPPSPSTLPRPIHLLFIIGLLLLAASWSPTLAQTVETRRVGDLRPLVCDGVELPSAVHIPAAGDPTPRARAPRSARAQVPTLQLGETLFESTGSPHEGVSTIWQLSGGIFLGPGQIVLGDARAPQLFLIDTESGEVQPVGRRGEGPGEFQRIRGPRRAPAGGFFVDDFMIARVTLFAADGSLLHTIAYNPAAFRSGPFVLRAIGVHSDGAIIFRDGEPLFSERPNGPYREKIGYRALTANGASATIAEADGLEKERRNYGGAFSAFDKPFSYSAVEAVAGDLVLVADTETGILSAYDRSGKVTMAFDFGPGEEVTREADRLWRAAMTERTNERNQTPARPGPDAPPEVAALMSGLRGMGGDDAREYYRNAEGNSIAPALSRVLVDGDGRVWAERFALPGAEKSPGSAGIRARSGSTRFSNSPRINTSSTPWATGCCCARRTSLGVQSAVVLTLRVAG